MPMYGLATIPLIRRLSGLYKQVWYADDSAVTGTIKQPHTWWNRLAEHGPAFGYFPNPTKTWIVVKQELDNNPVSVELDNNPALVNHVEFCQLWNAITGSLTIVVQGPELMMYVSLPRP